MRRTYFVLRKENEATVATTQKIEFAEMIAENLPFECIIRMVEYK